MKLDNGIISARIDSHGAEIKSAVKNEREYMWCGDGAYWARTSPVLFPFVGSLKDKKYTHNGSTYGMGQHGFARDMEFTLEESTESYAKYVLKADEQTFAKYPFDFVLIIEYTLENSTIKIKWTVENKGSEPMHFSIGAHPAFNLKDGDNYFGFDCKNDMVYNLINSEGLYAPSDRYTLSNDGFVKIENSMFDNDALIFENSQTREVSLCDKDRKPYVTVRFDAPLLGLWSPAKKNAPFVCIEPWYGRCDRSDFCGELKDREHSNTLEADAVFTAGYEIELL